MTMTYPVVPVVPHSPAKVADGPSDPKPRVPRAPGGAGAGTTVRDSYAVTALAEIIDRSLHAGIGRVTLGLSPAALIQTYFDWAVHLAFSPGKRLQLVDKATRKTLRLGNYMARCAMQRDQTPCIEPLPQDRRFDDDRWKTWPFNFIHQSFLLAQQLTYNATTGIHGVTAQHQAMIDFTSRQALDMISPSNFILTNPLLLDATVRNGGMNLVRGYQNFLEDFERAVSGKKPVGTEEFQVGGNLAVTPGTVIFRNRLIELIQYAPATAKVRPEPVLIVPAWIMKYYVLDLSPHNSLVKYLTEQGFTVFMISWRNPGPEDRDLGLDDYRELGIDDALAAINAVVPEQKIHAVGYCLGGTLLSIAAAAMARDGDDRLKTISLLAAQTDFTEAGELMLFIDESQLAFLDDLMWEQGFLDARQMSGTFQLLRSNDLIWSRLVRDYLMGERAPMTDLMAWNADSTRMPYRMHSEYLRQLFLKNDLAEGRYTVGGRPIALSDIRTPIFAVGTTTDHVAPWRSTYKIGLLTDTEVTYLLTTGGHNAGIVSEPGNARRRSFQVLTKEASGRYIDPDSYLNEAPRKDGSWWPQWVEWIEARSAGDLVDPPAMGDARQGYGRLCAAPGTYVLQD